MQMLAFGIATLCIYVDVNKRPLVTWQIYFRDRILKMPTLWPLFPLFCVLFRKIHLIQAFLEAVSLATKHLTLYLFIYAIKKQLHIMSFN